MNISEDTLNDLAAQLENHPYWFIGTTEQPKLAIYETGSGLLWDANPDLSSIYKIETANTAIEKINLLNLENWQLPTRQEIMAFAQKENPLKLGSGNRILGKYGWLEKTGCIDLDTFCSHLSWGGRVLVCNAIIADKTLPQRIQFFVKQNLQLRPSSNISAENLLADLMHKKAPALVKPAEISARDLALQEMLSSLLNTTVGSYCNEYLRSISVMNAQFNQLSELALLNSNAKSKK